MKNGDQLSSGGEPRYIVVPQDPHYIARRRLRVGGLLGAGLLLGLVIGYPLGYHHEKRAKVAAEQLQVELQETGDQVETMRGELAVHKHGNEVERQVSEHLRQEIVDLQTRLLEQEQTISLYKNILDPSRNQGLSVHAAEISRLGVPGRYAFKLVLVQPIDSPNEIAGTAIISVSGLQSGKQKLLEWAAIGDGKPAPTFKFKVYQDITGELKLPETFIPEKLLVRLGRPGSKAAGVSEYPWALKEAP